MKVLLILLFLFFSHSVMAGICTDSDKGLVPEMAGKIVYSLGDENCLGETCHTQMMKEFDRCLDSSTLLEFACTKGSMLEQEIRCSQSQICREGACTQK